MKHRSKNFNTTGIVLKRSNVGETDRIVTLLSRQHGRLVTVAKGVRKTTSSKRAVLEPGNYVKIHLIKTKGLPILTQAQLIADCAAIRQELPEIRKLTQFLEILERLFVEEEVPTELFDHILTTRDAIANQEISNLQIKKRLGDLVASLGYRHPDQTNHDSILDYVSELADRPMRSFEYLATSK